MSIPQIIIIEQLTPGHERFANDKVQKDVGVCVKKKGFPITIGTEEGKYDLSKVNITASLIYDNSSKAPVDFTDKAPLTYKTKLSKDKNTATIDVTLMVLSSQLENSLFLIKIRAENKKDKKDFREILSEPVKVVSKVTQLQTKAKKRTRNRSTPTKDMFINAMERLDNGQEKHSELLATLLKQSEEQTKVLKMLLEDESQDIVNTINQDDTILQDITDSNIPSKRVKIEVKEDENGKSSIANNNDQLDFAFKNLFDSFSNFEDEFMMHFNSNSINNNNNINRSSDLFQLTFDDEVINSESSPNQINSYDHSDEYPIEEDLLTTKNLENKNNNNNNNNKYKSTYVNDSIDFGSFPNLFSFDNNKYL